MRLVGCAAVLFMGGICAGSPARASETLTELPTGGLDFSGASNPSGLSLDEHEIKLSPRTVAIRYRLSNAGDTPLRVTVSFRLPDLDFADPDVAYAIPGADPVNFLDATFRIEDKPTAFTLAQMATMGGRNVTDQLRRAKLALIPVGAFQNQLAATTAETRAKLKQQQLIVETGATVDGDPLYAPAWSVTTVATREVVVAPHGGLTIAVAYKASAGASRDTVLRKPLRDERTLAPLIEERRRTFCVDDAFLNGLDRIAGTTGDVANALTELRMKIVLKRGGAGPPAKKFHLVFDKLSPNRIVSFCMDNLKKTSPTTFEMRAENYSPAADLDILMIDQPGRPVRPAQPTPARPTPLRTPSPDGGQGKPI